MKHTKYFIIPLVIFSFFISSCSKDDILIENNESALNEGKKSGGKANSFYEEGLPKIKFIPKGEGTNIYTIVLKDPAQTATVQVRGRVKYNVLQFHFHAPSEQRATLELNDVDFLVEKFNTDAKVKNITFPAPVENWILSISLEYLEGDVVVKTFEYSLFVFADGTTALQQPEVRITKKGLVGSWSFDDSHGTDNSSATYSIIVENDPAEIVETVEVLFDEKTSSPAPKSYTNYLKRKAKYGQHMIFSGVISFTENPEGSSFTLQIALLDGSGNEISLLENAVSICLKPGPGKEGARIHAVRIKESNKGNNESTHEIAALVLNIKQERMGYVEVKFNEPFDGPKPINNISRLRKRPEILYQEWDNLIDENLLTVIQNNPLSNGEYGIEFNPLFEKSAVGYTYTVTATIFDKNEKQIGKPQTFNVTVEGETNETDPVIQSTRLFSTDGGKTWNLEAVIEDKSQWVEKVQVEFEKPFEGPAPVINPIELTQVAEKEGNIKIYSGKVEFNGNPDGFDYIAIIYLRNGSGGYGDSVVARAPVRAHITHEYH